jgi:hypothetical protein
MKTLTLTASAAVGLVLALSAPAQAHPQSNYGHQHATPTAYRAPAPTPFQYRASDLQRRIDIGLRRGALSPREAQALRHELRRISRTYDSYRVDGVSPTEARDLDARFDRLASRLRYERYDRDGYAHNDPRDANYGPYDPHTGYRPHR